MKTDETIRKPPSIYEDPPFQLTPPLLLSNFFMTPLCPNFENKNPPPPNFRGEETMMAEVQ